MYVHVPFCRDRCTYCAFPTVADDPYAHEPLVDALLGEAARAPIAAPLRTLYLGGGTPGLLAPHLIERLVTGLRAHGPWAPEAEVTIEVNPANVTAETLRAWTGCGINRLSVGVQTFRNDALRELARRHDAEAARRALSLVADRWSGSWSADLLIGWRGQEVSDVRRDVEQLMRWEPPHVSIYGLTIEPRTALEARARRGHVVAAPESLHAEMDDTWSAVLHERGYERYEVSNFARAHHRSQHNQAYWANGSYLGLGPGAAGSVHPFRWRNLADPTEYVARIADGRPVREFAERVSPQARLLESLAIGLRTRDGLGTDELDRRFSPAWRTVVEDAAAPLLDQGILQLDDATLRLPPAELVRADRVVSEIAMMVES